MYRLALLLTVQLAVVLSEDVAYVEYYNATVTQQPTIHNESYPIYNMDIPTNYFDVLAMYWNPEEIFGSINLNDFGLDTSTKSGFNAEVESIFDTIRLDVCQVEKKCQSSMYLGCSCKKSLYKLGAANECSMMPCEVFDHVYMNIAPFFRSLQSSRSLVEFTEAITSFIEPVVKMLCRCPKMYTIAEKCLTGWDGDVVGKEEHQDVRRMMKEANVKTILNIAKRIMGSICGSTDGECVQDFLAASVKSASMFDRSFDEEAPICSSYRRLGDELMEMAMSIAESDDVDIGSVIDQYLDFFKSFWCSEKKCAEDLADAFYGCCQQDLVKTMNVNTISGLIKWVKNTLDRGDLDMSTEFLGYLLNNKKVIKKMIKGMSPSRSCPKVYKNKVDMCM